MMDEQDEKKEGEMAVVQEVLARVCNANNLYSLHDLRQRPLPDGINPLCIETYLTDQEFEVRPQIIQVSLFSSH
jgi:supervillin